MEREKCRQIHISRGLINFIQLLTDVTFMVLQFIVFALLSLRSLFLTLFPSSSSLLAVVDVDSRRTTNEKEIEKSSLDGDVHESAATQTSSFDFKVHPHEQWVTVKMNGWKVKKNFSFSQMTLPVFFLFINSRKLSNSVAFSWIAQKYGRARASSIFPLHYSSITSAYSQQCADKNRRWQSTLSRGKRQLWMLAGFSTIKKILKKMRKTFSVCFSFCCCCFSKKAAKISRCFSEERWKQYNTQNDEYAHVKQ